MKQVFVFLWLVIGGCTSVFGQKTTVKAEVSADTIEWGNYLSLEVSIKGSAQQVQLKPFELKDFEIVGGPMQSSSYSNINGKVSQMSTYTFHLQPKQSGALKIESIPVSVDDEEIQTKPIGVYVIENQENSYQQNRIDRPTPSEGQKTKKNRNTIRI